MTDYDKFGLALSSYLNGAKECTEEELWVKYVRFQNEIENLKCNDFRWYYHRAHYLNTQNEMEEARIKIDRTIELSNNLSDDLMRENCIYLTVPFGNGSKSRYSLGLSSPNKLFSDVYLLAGEIYAKTGNSSESLDFYKIGQYYGSLLKSEFEDYNSISLFSFRRYNEYSLSDLINNTITVSPSTMMNDPFDSIINLWAEEKRMDRICKEKKHIKPLCSSFSYYRLRAFASGKDNEPVQNVLMWSHYAAEHNGFCIKYNLSKHFIKQAENDQHEHMYLKKIKYSDEKTSILTDSIKSDLAFATKKKDWEYENEVRLIVYNPNKEDSHYGIELDNDSRIEAIFFGYRCPENTINTIKSIFYQQQNKDIKFYKMDLDEDDVYSLRYVEL